MSRYFLFLLLLSNLAWSQALKLEKSISTGFVISSSKVNTFLLRANQYGVVPFESGTAFISGNIFKNYDSLYSIKTKKLKKFDYGFGLEPYINLGKVNQALLVQAYGKVRLGVFELYAGRRKEVMGLMDTTGTMGSYIWSGNALPLPKVEISFQNYVPILGKGLVSIKGNFAHGWFGSTDSVKTFYLHQKSIYTKIGKPNWKINLQMGINHQVQWGGYPSKPYLDPITKKMVTNYGNDFSTFVLASTAVRLGKVGNDGVGNSGSGNEQTNRQGNHLGSVDIALNISTKLGNLMLYRQSIYDDGSLYYLNNIEDGLNGISFEPFNGPIRNIGFEYLKTDWQGGPYFSDLRNELRGFDNYFKNLVYSNGWVYNGNTIGTPFINGNKNNSIQNNRNQVYILHVNGEVFKIPINVFIINYKNKGLYTLPISKEQLSTSIFITKTLGKNFSSNFQLTLDNGKYWSNGYGFKLKITKTII